MILNEKKELLFSSTIKMFRKSFVPIRSHDETKMRISCLHNSNIQQLQRTTFCQLFGMISFLETIILTLNKNKQISYIFIFRNFLVVTFYNREIKRIHSKLTFHSQYIFFFYWKNIFLY